MSGSTAPRTVPAYGQHEVIGTGWMWVVEWGGVWQPEMQSSPSLSWTASLGSCFRPGPSWAGSRNESTGWRAVSLPPSDRWAPMLRRETASFKKQGYVLPRHSQPSSLQITFSCLVGTATVSLLIFRRLLFWPLFRVHLLWEFLATNFWQSHPEPATHPISTESFDIPGPFRGDYYDPETIFQPFMVS